MKRTRIKQQTTNQLLMQETVVDPRLTTAEEHAEGVRQAHESAMKVWIDRL